MPEIGLILRETRMRARIDISQVEADTKIRAKYLRALENEEWGLLPGNVYVRSFLRTYAEYLGIDPRPLLDEYQRRTEFAVDHSPRQQRRSRERRREPTQRQRARSSPLLSPPVMIGGALVVILVALAAVGLLFNSNNKNGGGTASPGTRTTRTVAGTHTRTQPSQSRSNTTTTPASVASTLEIVPHGTVYVCVKLQSGKTLVATTLTSASNPVTVRGDILLVTFGTAYATAIVDGTSHTFTASSTPIGLRIEHGAVTRISQGPICG